MVWVGGFKLLTRADLNVQRGYGMGELFQVNQLLTRASLFNTFI